MNRTMTISAVIPSAISSGRCSTRTVIRRCGAMTCLWPTVPEIGSIVLMATSPSGTCSSRLSPSRVPSTDQRPSGGVSRASRSRTPGRT
ncbi:MAG: hypothetical protein ACYS1B_01190 [Planctomycetota bacterium]